MRTSRWLVASVLVAATCCPPAALAAGPGFYFALDGGQARFSGIEGTAIGWFTIPPGVQMASSGEGYDVLGSTPATPSIRSEDHGAYRATAGYQINTYFGIELSYADLGRVRATGGGMLTWGHACDPGFSCPQVISEDTYTSQGRLDVRGWDVAVTGSVPLNSQWSLLARLGAVRCAYAA